MSQFICFSVLFFAFQGMTKKSDVATAKKMTGSCPEKGPEDMQSLGNKDVLVYLCFFFFSFQGMTKKSELATAVKMIGSCPDMCPEKERYMREVQRRLSPYEMMPGQKVSDL